LAAAGEDATGTYRFRFVPRMPDVPLKGIIGVGIEIVR
jgi:hypothetical protein